MTPLKGILQVLLGPKLQGEERNFGPMEEGEREFGRASWKDLATKP